MCLCQFFPPLLTSAALGNSPDSSCSVILDLKRRMITQVANQQLVCNGNKAWVRSSPVDLDHGDLRILFPWHNPASIDWYRSLCMLSVKKLKKKKKTCYKYIEYYLAIKINTLPNSKNNFHKHNIKPY